MKAVIDANVIISALRFGGKPRYLLDACSRGELEAFASDVTIYEIKEVLLKKFKLVSSEWDAVSGALEEIIDIIPVAQLPFVPQLRDGADLHVLAAAELVNADYIVSGDKDLLVLGHHRDIPIVTVNQMINKLT